MDRGQFNETNAIVIDYVNNIIICDRPVRPRQRWLDRVNNGIIIMNEATSSE